MKQLEQMARLGYRYIGQGYLHNVYEKDGLIYKCLKRKCMRDVFHKFEHEKACMDFLRENEIPTVKVTDIIQGEILPDVCFLVEEKASGTNYSKKNLPEELREPFFNYLMKITAIKMPFWGDTKPDGTKNETDWIDFLKSYIRGLDALPEDIKKGNTEKYLAQKMRKYLPDHITPHFLVMDSNPENFFWDEKNEICSVIDIDHPICGDPLFQIASILYEWGSSASEYINKMVSKTNMDRVLFYRELIYFNDILLNKRLDMNDQ